MSNRTPAHVVKYCLAGALATGTHVLVASTLIGSLAVHPAAANGFAFCAATLTSYMINTFWTFRRPVTRRNAVRFWVVAATGLCGTVAISGAAAAAGLHYLIGIALVLLLVTPLTFALHSSWTYGR